MKAIHILQDGTELEAGINFSLPLNEKTINFYKLLIKQTGEKEETGEDIKNASSI